MRQLKGRLLRFEPLEDRPLLSQLISNGSFSQPISSSDWITSGNFYADSTGAHTNYHTAPGYAYLSQPGGNPGNNLIGSMYQQFTVPATATSVTLAYWYNITTTEPGGTGNDFLNVTLQNSSGQYLTGVGFYSNLYSGTVGVYSEASYDLSSFKGQTLRINFLGTTNGSYPTMFRIDDVSVTATSPAAAPSIATVSPVSMPPSTSPQSIKVYGSNFDTSASHLLFTDPQGNVWTSANHPSYETRVSSTEFDYQVDNNSDTGTWNVKVQNPDGQISNAVNFTVATPVSAPVVSTVVAGSVFANTAVMNGTVNPNGASTSAYFQYGTTTSYGNTGQAQTGITTTTNVQTTLTGLAPSTTYHYRLVASNSGGTSYGSDTSFTTMSAAVTLTLYVHAGSATGPLLSGAEVTGQDAAGNTFNQTTNTSGYVVLTGIPGMWQFAASDAGYPTNTWGQSITATGTKNAYLIQQVAATAKHLAFFRQPTTGVLAGSVIAPAVVVEIEDSNNNIVANDNSSVTLSLNSGTATLGGAVTVAAVNGKATFSNLTVSTAGTFTLQATDGADAPVTSVSFAVASSPRDQLIQALTNLEKAVATYQTAAISVFAAADVALAELIYKNQTFGDMFSNEVGDLANNAVGLLAQALVGNATGEAVNLVTAFLLPLSQDMAVTAGVGVESYVANWLTGKTITGNPANDQANLAKYFGDGLVATTSSLGASLTDIISRIPPSLPASFPEASVITSLENLTRQVERFTPQTNTSVVGAVGWALPGVDLTSLGGPNPITLGETSSEAASVASAVGMVNKAKTISTWIDRTNIVLGGAAVLVAPTGFGLPATAVLEGVSTGLSLASGWAVLNANQEAVDSQVQGILGLSNDVTLVGCKRSPVPLGILPAPRHFGV